MLTPESPRGGPDFGKNRREIPRGGPDFRKVWQVWPPGFWLYVVEACASLRPHGQPAGYGLGEGVMTLAFIYKQYQQ